MSTLKVTNVQHPSAVTAAITFAADGGMTGTFPVANRNLLHNGAMQVAQRGLSVTGITTAGYRTADRWGGGVNFGTWTQDIQDDAPTGSGFRKSLRLLCTTAKASLAAGDWVYVSQALEGQDVQRISKGTSSAQQLTFSFWVKANVTGTYTTFLYDYTNNRQVNAAYTVSSSATWEKKIITFPADTTGAITNDNAAGFALGFTLAAGSTYTSGTLATTWGTYVAANQSAGQVNLAAATNNYWQVTGVQLETGPAATAFEFKSYGQELRECQRYYYRIAPTVTNQPLAMGFNDTTTAAMHQGVFPVRMRISPTAVETTGTASHYGIKVNANTIVCSAVPTLLDATTDSYVVYSSVSSGLTAGYGSRLIAGASTAGYLGFSTDL